MKNRLFLVVGMIMLAITTASAQKITKGDKKLSFLAGETTFNIQYDYDDMMVGKISETAYRKKKVSEMNAKQKGKGEKWEAQWVASRTEKYEPKLEELMNKYLSESGASDSQGDKDAKYTIVIKTVMTEPGYNAVVSKKNPFCNFEISWIETATGNIMAAGILNNIQGVIMMGSDFDFDPSNGIKESYAKAGKVVAKTMLKAMKLKKK